MTTPSTRLRSQHGLTMPELMLSLAIIVIVALPLAGLVYKGSINRQSGQVSMASQQATSLVLTQFTTDVRAATGLMSSVTDYQNLVLRQPTPTGTYVYVSYRFADQKLQRGTSTDLNASPATWTNIIDPAMFAVQKGDFSYYTLNNLVATKAKDARRIQLGNLELKSMTSTAVVKPDALSAVMREMSNARALRRNGPPPSVIRDKGAVWVKPNAINLTGQSLTIGAFAVDWTDLSADPSPLDTLDMIVSDQNGKVTTWKAGPTDRYMPNDPARSFPDIVTVNPTTQLTMQFKFRDTAVITKLTVRFYDPADTTCSNPYVVPIL